MEKSLHKLPSILRAKWTTLSSLAQRTITAAVLAPLFFIVLYIGGFPFHLVMIAIALLAWREWRPLVQSVRIKAVDYGAYAFVFLGIYLGLSTSLKMGLITLALGVLYMTVVSHVYIDKGDRRAPPWLCFGVLYVGLPCLLIAWLRYIGDVSLGDKGWVYTAILFFQVWATDTGAYIAGRTVGGPKLAPAVSPNKTWSGLLGGMFASCLVTGGFAILWALPHANWYFLAGLVLAVVAQLGDLFESYVKRRAGVKDSGHIIPGHGGILDRIDGLLASAPVFFLFVFWLL